MLIQNQINHNCVIMVMTVNAKNFQKILTLCLFKNFKFNFWLKEAHMLLHTVGYSAGPSSLNSIVSSSPWLTTNGA